MPTIRYVCDDCGDEFDTEEDYHQHRHNCRFCDTVFCGEDAYFDHQAEYCDACDAHHCSSDYSHEDCGGDYGDGEGIFNYSHKPRAQFHGTGDYFLGVELEISARSGSSAYPIYDWARNNGHDGLFYCKEDSSVCGFEIVTHPMSPSYFESVDWDAFMAMLNREYPLRNGNTEENNEHGLHVHISRSAFRSPVHLARWSLLLNRSSEHVERIARRSGSGWAAFRARSCVSDVLATDNRVASRFIERHMARTPIRCTCDGCVWLPEDQRTITGYRAAVGYKRIRPDYPPRYSVTNMHNDHTVEVRAFKSTRNADEFRDSVRLVYTSADYVASHATSAHVIPSWGAFTEYVRDNVPAYFPTVCGLAAA